MVKNNEAEQKLEMVCTFIAYKYLKRVICISIQPQEAIPFYFFIFWCFPQLCAFREIFPHSFLENSSTEVRLDKEFLKTPTFKFP